MAGPGYSSPFPTTHDTIGASTLATAAYMPSSPPQSKQGSDDGVDHLRNIVSESVAAQNSGDRRSGRSRSSSPLSRSSSLGSGNDFDARLAEYTLDLSRFSGGQFGLDDRDDDQLPDLSTAREEDRLSEIGGPEDFTEHMERYLWGDGLSSKSNKNDDKAKEEGEPSQLPLEAVAEDEGELGEYSEFGPPVDMSTPSQFLRRNPHPGKEVTQLEGIEESPPQSPSGAASPSMRRPKDAPEEGDSDDLRRQIENLQQQLREKDEQIQAERKKALEGEAAVEQVNNLQTELSRMTALLKETQEKRGEEEAMLHEQIESLQIENDEKNISLQNSKTDKLRLEALEQQVETLQAELKRRDESLIEKDESSKTADTLKEKLEVLQNEIKKRDEDLENNISKLNELTTAKDLQLQQKNTEIETLKAQISDRNLEIQKLEEELDAANDEYEALEERIASLESKNKPLEEKNHALETELGDVRSQLTAQEDALKAVASDLSVQNEGRTFVEILDVIKGAYLAKIASPLASPTSKTDLEEEVDNLRKQLAQSEKQSKEVASTKEALEAQLKRSEAQVSESQGLITTIEAENSRLTSRVDELTSNLKNLQGEWHNIKEQHVQLLGTIERIRKGNETQQSSGLPSPSEPTPNLAATQEAHEAQLKSLQTAHATAISTLRSSHAESLRKLRNQLTAAEKRESQLKSELEGIRASESEQRSYVKSLSAKIEKLGSIITAKEEAAAALDLRIAKSVEKREKEWERRVDLLLKEREKMSKALLWAWGEKEVGDSVKDNGDENHKGPRQGYRYKYAVKGKK